MVKQVIGITCVTLECQEHPLFDTKGLFVLIPLFQPCLPALSTLSFHQCLLITCGVPQSSILGLILFSYILMTCIKYQLS